MLLCMLKGLKSAQNCIYGRSRTRVKTLFVELCRSQFDTPHVINFIFSPTFEWFKSECGQAGNPTNFF